MNKRLAKKLFVEHIIADFERNKKHHKKSVERLGMSVGIEDKTEVKEFVELAIVLKARMIARSSLTIRERFDRIVSLYDHQVILSHRTSHSMLLQQYSTPAPISFLAGIFANIDHNVTVFEPSAGNGLLTIAADPSRVTVNEIDDLRRSNLSEQGYARVLNQNATQAFRDLQRSFDAVLTNPPFGTLDREVVYDATIKVTALDHLMALRALETMKDNGKASIIIGGHTRYDAKGRIQGGRNRIFFNYLYNKYTYVDEAIEEMDDIAVAEGKQVALREGTSQAGVDNEPYFSKIFNVINQMLFSLKAEVVADRAIMRLREGKKPVIAFASTMGSFIEQMENERGLPVSDGDTINADFSEVLQKGLDGVLRYTETSAFGKRSFGKLKITDLSIEAQANYARISNAINSISTGITISPIDIIIQKLINAGYTVAEVTGRKYELQINSETNHALIKSRKKINTNDAFRQFNNNEADVLLINQSGSTGASAHAIVTSKVPRDQVKQRVMIVLQLELDINKEVQKRGRINRTGQIILPIYEYPISAIPAEMRLMMMLQKKLKSLDANTTSNQKSSTKILDVPDFLNKYGG